MLKKRSTDWSLPLSSTSSVFTETVRYCRVSERERRKVTTTPVSDTTPPSHEASVISLGGTFLKKCEAAPQEKERG